VVFFCCVEVDGGPLLSCNTLESQEPPYVLSSSAVAVSTDGKNWELVDLGGDVAGSDDGDTASWGTLVVFVKSNDTVNPASDGYFIAATQRQSSFDGINRGALYKSEDGREWNLVKTTDERMYEYLSAIAKKPSPEVVK